MNVLNRIKSIFPMTKAPVVTAPVVTAPVIRRTTLPSSIQGRAFFESSATTRLVNDWAVTNSTADKELRTSLDVLRARSRQLAFNDPYLRKFIRLLENNVIGPSGILLGAKAKRDNGELDTYDNAQIEREWYDWCKKGNCDTSETYTFVEIQKQIIRSVATDGEVFIKIIRNFNNRSKFALRLYEADWLATKFNITLANGNIVRMGVEVDPDDKPVAYYFYNHNPADDPLSTISGVEVTRIPASDIIHIYYRDRISQHRGTPWGICNLLNTRHINKYIESEVVAARVAAAQMGFLKTPTGTEYTGETNEDYFTEMEVEPGIFKQLPKGWSIESFNPLHPTTQFPQFINTMIRGLAVGYGVGYSNLSSDRAGVTYSSLRQEALEEQDNWKTLQGWFIDSFMEPAYVAWLNTVVKSVLPLPQSKIKKFMDIVWYPRRWAWVDPQKDIAAQITALQNKLTSRTKILSEQGLDFEELIQEIANEKLLMEKYGITDSEIQEQAQKQPEDEDEQEQSKQIQ
jgi:lambda family phage portal protein